MDLGLIVTQNLVWFAPVNHVSVLAVIVGSIHAPVIRAFVTNVTAIHAPVISITTVRALLSPWIP
jgi:hypothetical protein